MDSHSRSRRRRLAHRVWLPAVAAIVLAAGCGAGHGRASSKTDSATASSAEARRKAAERKARAEVSSNLSVIRDGYSADLTKCLYSLEITPSFSNDAPTKALRVRQDADAPKA